MANGDLDATTPAPGLMKNAEHDETNAASVSTRRDAIARARAKLLGRRVDRGQPS